MKSIKLSLSLLFLSSLAACQAPVNSIQPQVTAPQVSSQSTVNTARFNDTAKDALRWAEMDARRWDFSADLVKVEGSDVRENGKSGEWTFYFKAPFKRNVLKISGRNKEEVRDSFFGSEFNSLTWKVDSAQVVEILKKNGLKKFPVLEMTLESRFGLEWDVRTWDGRFTLDAKTGKITKK